MPTFLKLPPSVEQIERGDKVIFLNPEMPAWLVTNANGASLLSLCNGENAVEDILAAIGDDFGSDVRVTADHFFHEAKASGIFEQPAKGDIPITEERQRLSMVQLSVSPTCNLNCKYCYATDRHEKEPQLTLDDYRQLVDDIVAHYGPVSFSITGGEPLMNRDCFAIAAYIRQKGCATDLLSNATLINEQNIGQVKQCFDRVTVSLDGSTKQRHETFRGPHTYDRTMHALQLMERQGIDFMLSMTVNRLNIGDVEAMAKKYGPRLNFAPLFPAGNAKKDLPDLSISGMDYYRALKSANGVNPLGYCEPTLDASLRCRRCKCAVGGSEVSVSASGDVYPCQLLHYPQFLMGNVHHRQFHDILDASPVVKQCARMTVDNIRGCNVCALRYICGGACRARSFHEGGDIMSSSDFCQYEREAFLDGIVAIYSRNAL